MRISSWLNVSYALNIRRRWRIVVIYLLVMLMFFLLNYGLLVSAKLLAGASHPLLSMAGESSYWFSFGWWN